MPGITRKDDIAGGAITNTQSTVKADGKYVIVQGDPVATHGPHVNPTMADHSSKVRAAGKWVCRAGDKASCGHAANGSSDVNAG